MAGVNTNIMSLTAQRNMSTAAGSLATTMNRLSSGLRVNSAKDDAAGLAIAERMNAQVKGMNVAARNANDGISMAQTAESALGKVGDNLQRMRELAIQSRNGTNSDSDKDSLNKEFKQLQSEVNRVLSGTKFNGKAILGEDAKAGLRFQVGAGTSQDDQISVSASDLLNDAGMKTAYSGAKPATFAATDKMSTSNGVSVDRLKGLEVKVATTDTISSLTDNGKAAFATMVQNAAQNTVVVANGGNAAATQNAAGFNLAKMTVLQMTQLGVNTADLKLATSATDYTDAGAAIATTTLDALSSSSQAAMKTALSSIDLTKVDQTQSLATLTAGFSTGATAGAPTVAQLGTANIFKKATADTVFGDLNAASQASLSTVESTAGVNAGTAMSIGSSIDNDGLKKVIDNLDKAIDRVSSQRAEFGAVQTRFEAVIGNLQVSSENQAAARSRIMDTDYATETANLSRTQVLQQASQAMLAQANQAPQSVLQLLR